MTAGRLAAAKPAATTNTVIYRCPPTLTGSTVVNVCNQSGSAATYRLGLRDYDQVLHLDGQEAENGGTASTYKFERGNPVSAYKLSLTPGFQYSDAIPGTEFLSTNGATGKILDIFKATSDVTYYTIVDSVTNVSLQADSTAGTFEGGETLTGSISGLTATYRGGDATALTLALDDVASGATSVKISRTTGLADGQVLTIGGVSDGGEIVSIDASGINTTTNTLTITRAALGTTAAAIPVGLAVTAWSESAVTSTIDEGATYATSDTTLTVADSTGFVTGSIIKIDNELLAITDVNGNDITVDRGVYGTSDVDHNNGSTVTQMTDNGTYLINHFSEGETLTGGSSNATAILDFDAATSATNSTKYLFTTTSDSATDHVQFTAIDFNLDRTYIFDLSDSTCNNYPLKISADDPEGPNGSGTEYTQGVSKVGTAGTTGAFTSIVITTNTTPNLFLYADGTPSGETQGIGLGATVQTNPTYEEVFIYDVGGEALVDADTFTINGVTQTINASGVTAGPFGIVTNWDPDKAHLKIALSPGSEAFANGDEFYDTPTLNNGNRTIVRVVDGKILTVTNIAAANASRSEGTYSNLTANSTSGSGDITTARFTVDVDNSGAATITIVNGGKDFVLNETVTINDSQLGAGGAPALTFDVATFSTGVTADQTDIYNAEDYLFYDNAIGANETEKNSAIVVGPGQSLVAYSSAGDLSYVVNGFESVSDDLPVVNMTKVNTDGGVAP